MSLLDLSYLFRERKVFFQFYSCELLLKKNPFLTFAEFCWKCVAKVTESSMRKLCLCFYIMTYQKLKQLKEQNRLRFCNVKLTLKNMGFWDVCLFWIFFQIWYESCKKHGIKECIHQPIRDILNLFCVATSSMIGSKYLWSRIYYFSEN